MIGLAGVRLTPRLQYLDAGAGPFRGQKREDRNPLAVRGRILGGDLLVRSGLAVPLIQRDMDRKIRE